MADQKPNSNGLIDITQQPTYAPSADASNLPNAIPTGGQTGAEPKPAIVSPTPHVPMFSPDGQLGDIPSERVNEAISAGGMIASPVIAPDGTRGMVPANRLHEALQAGGKIDSTGWAASPSFAQRALATVAGPGTIGADIVSHWASPRPVDATNPQAVHEELAKPIVAPINAMSDENKANHPFLRAGAEFAGALSSPENLAIMVGSGGLGKLPGAAGPILEKALSTGFGIQMLYQAAQESPKFIDALARGDEAEAKYELMKVVLNTAAAEQSAEHVTGINPTLGGAGQAVTNAVGKRAAAVGQGVANAASTVASRVQRGLGIGDDFYTTVKKISPPAKGYAMEYNDTLKAAEPQLRQVMRDTPDVSTPKELYDAIDNHIKQNDAFVAGQAAKIANSPQATMTGVAARVLNTVRKAFDENKGQYTPEEQDKAISSVMDHLLQETPASQQSGNRSINGREPNIAEIEGVRQRFNKDANPVFGSNAPSVPAAEAFAKSVAAKEIRNSVDQKFDQLGVKDVKEWRKQESALVDVRDQIADAIKKSDEMGTYNVFDSLTKQLGWKTLLGFAAGAGGGAETGVVGAIAASGLGAVADYIRDLKLNPNRKVEKAAKMANAELAPNANIPSLAVQQAAGAINPAGAGGNPPPQGSPAVAAPTANPANPANPAGTSAAGTKINLPVEEEPRPQYPTLPGQAARAWDQPDTHAPDTIYRHQEKSLAELGIDPRKYPPLPGQGSNTALPPAKNVDLPYELPSGPIQPTPAARRPGMFDKDVLTHEWGHITNAALEGFTPNSIKSHLHPDQPPTAGASAAVTLDNVDLRDPASVARNMGRILSTVLGGGIANELHSGIPFERSGTSADLRIARHILGDLGFNHLETEAAIEYGKDRAKRNLTQPGIGDILKQNAAVREEGLAPEYHASPARVADYAKEVTRIQNENRSAGNSGTDAGTEETVHGNDNGNTARASEERPTVDTGTKAGVPGRNAEANRAQKPAEQPEQQKFDFKTSGLKERSTGDKDIDSIIKQAGAVPAGRMDDILLFHDPKTGSTLAHNIAKGEITPEVIANHLAASRKQFGLDLKSSVAEDVEKGEKGENSENGEDTSFNFGHNVEFAENKPAEKTPILDKLKTKYGTTNDKLATAFITPEGERIGVQDHDQAVKSVTPDAERLGSKEQDKKAFINNEQVVRTGYRTSKAGPELVFSVPEQGVTEQQIAEMRQSVGKMGRNGNVTMETAEGAGKSAKKEFAKPSDIDGMLQEIGAHPEQQKTAEQKEQAIAEQAAEESKKQGGFTADFRTGKPTDTGYLVEISPEHRVTLDHDATPKDIQKFYNDNRALFAEHPELRVGGFGKELNISAHTDNLETAKQLGRTLDRESIFDAKKKETIPTGGKGQRQEFTNYPLAQRMQDVREETEKGPAGFEHMPKDLHDSMEPDEREFVKDNKVRQQNITKAYRQIKPSLEETTNSMNAGAMNAGWWQRFIDTFDMMGGNKKVAKELGRLGPTHGEALKQWHSAVSGNKSVEDAVNLAGHSYLDWLDAGRPTDRESINAIVKKNAAQPEGSGKKGNAAISDTLDKNGNVISKGLDTSKLYKLVNSPEMQGKKAFGNAALGGNPLAGVSPGAIKIPSMGATVAGKGNLNRLVLDAHGQDFYGQNGWNDATYLAHSIHMRKAAEALGLKGGEGQEQQWGVVLGLKELLKQGLSPAEAAKGITDDFILQKGKDYAEIIKNDPESNAIFERMKKYGLKSGEEIQSGLDKIISGRPKARQETGTNQNLLENTAKRIREQISPSKIKTSSAKDKAIADKTAGVLALMRGVK